MNCTVFVWIRLGEEGAVRYDFSLAALLPLARLAALKF
jgi:hypothetical protein